MASDERITSKSIIKSCKAFSLSRYPVKHPTYTTLSRKNFQNAVDFFSNEKSPCKNTWYRDLKSSHIRNEHLLDLPFSIPKCCSNIYNISLDRQKLKKVKRYGLTRPVRSFNSTLEPEEEERCIPKQVTKDINVTIFPECYILPESSSDEDDDDESMYELCQSNSVSQCSQCSTLGDTVTGLRLKMHKIVKKNWRSLLHISEREVCQDAVAQEIKKHKQGQQCPLRLTKTFAIKKCPRKFSTSRSVFT